MVGILPLADELGADVTFEAPAEAATVEVAEGDVIRALRNLLLNALRHGLGDTRRVTLRVTGTDDAVTFAVVETGTIQGGGTELPQNGGQPAIDLDFTAERLATEHRIGWTARQVEQALSGFRDLDASLAMVDISITDASSTVVGCAARSIDITATCAQVDSRGRVVRQFTDRLVDIPGTDALSVQRASAPVTATS